MSDPSNSKNNAMKRIKKEHKQTIKTNTFYKTYKNFKFPKADTAEINTTVKCTALIIF